MKRWQVYSIICSCLSLLACSTMTEKECLVANWYDLGLADGAAGYTLSMFSERANDCAKHDIDADRQAYLQARKEGLKTYCTKANGYSEGADGRAYQGVCEGNLAKQFLPAYQKGKDLYVKKSAVQNLERKINQVDKDIDKHNNDTLRLKKHIIEENDKGKRASLILDLERIDRKLVKLKADKARLLQQYRVAEKELQNLLNQ